MTFNITVEREQDQHIRNDLAATEARVNRQIDSYGVGEFDRVYATTAEQKLITQVNEVINGEARQ